MLIAVGLPMKAKTAEDYQDVFSTSPTDLGSCPLLPFTISVPPDSPPVRSKPYRMNPFIAKQVDIILDKYLAAGLVQHSTSPCSSPIVVVPKKAEGISASLSTINDSTRSAP